jgi:membrane protease YdiL (CAAX protease family)
MKKLLIVILKILGFFILWGAFACVIFIEAVGKPVFAEGNWVLFSFWAEFIPFVAVIIATLIFLAIEKKRIKLNLFQNFKKNSLLGLIVGVEWICVPLLVMLVMGLLVATPTLTEQINLLPTWLFLLIIAFFFDTIVQEFFVRGYIFQLLKREYNLIAAIAVTTVIFTFLYSDVSEGGILNLLNIMTMSIFLSLLLVHTKTLLAPIVAHAVWYMVAALLGCLKMAETFHPLLDLTIGGNKIFSGGDYKLEGSIFMLIIKVINIAVFTYIIKVKRN